MEFKMFSLPEFQTICRIFATYTANAITPLQVMMRLRQLKRYDAIRLLSNAFEEMPGYMNYTIQEFIDAARLKTIIE
jgi:hypothetical protein